jgi:hypothetical protein
MDINKIPRSVIGEAKLTIHTHPSQLLKAKDYANSQLSDIGSEIVEDDTLSPTIFYVIDPRFANVRQVST